MSTNEPSVDAHFVAMNASQDMSRLIKHIWFLAILIIGGSVALLSLAK
jgi:hypothetical protein